MTNEQYIEAMGKIGTVASIAADLPLEEVCAVFEGGGRILLIHRDSPEAQLQRELIDAMLRVKRVALRCRAHVARHSAEVPVIQREEVESN